MPIFEYVCSDCEYRFEKLERSDATFQMECPACGSPGVAKVISTFAAAGSSKSCSTSAGGG